MAGHRKQCQTLPGDLHAAGQTTSTTFHSKRRRWESNPLRSGCSRLPCRLAPASVIKCSRQESNLVFDLRKVACESSTLRERLIQYPAEESNLARRLRKPSCILHTRRAFCVSIPTWTRTRAWTFGESNAIRYTIGTYQRADDWIRTSMLPLTRRTPFSVEPRRQSAAAAAARA